MCPGPTPNLLPLFGVNYLAGTGGANKPRFVLANSNVIIRPAAANDNVKVTANNGATAILVGGGGGSSSQQQQGAWKALAAGHLQQQLGARLPSASSSQATTFIKVDTKDVASLQQYTRLGEGVMEKLLLNRGAAGGLVVSGGSGGGLVTVALPSTVAQGGGHELLAQSLRQASASIAAAARQAKAELRMNERSTSDEVRGTARNYLTESRPPPCIWVLVA